MKTKILLIMMSVLFLDMGVSKATHYLAEDGDFFSTIALFNNDTLLMNGGNGETLTLGDYAIANIENTDLPIGITDIISGGYGIINIYGGGIGNIQAINESIINMTGGSVNSLEMYHESMLYLYGGNIGSLASAQPLILIPPEDPGPHGWIQFFCREYDYNSDTNLLTGLWADSSAFSINLSDIGTYPTYDQIEFHIIPEPATILLLSLGGLWLKKRRSR